MQKNALPITLATLVAAIFGSFLRWLQTRNIFDESGLAIRGAAISIIYAVYTVLVLAAICVLAAALLKHCSAPKEADAALADPTVFPFAAAVALAAVFICCAVVAMFTADSGKYPIMQRIFGAFGIFAGLCLPFLPGKKSGGHSSFSGTAAVVLTLFCCYWLVFDYRLNAENPVMWAYAPELLATIATTLAIYHIAAYFHGRAKPRPTLITVLAAVFFDISVVFDARALWLTGLYAVSALMLLIIEFLLLSNLKESDT